MPGCLRVRGGGVREQLVVLLLCCQFKWHQTYEGPVRGGYSGPEEHLWGVCGRSQRGLCGMIGEVSGWDFSGWVCGRSLGGVSVGALSGRTSMGRLSSPTTAEGWRDEPLLGFALLRSFSVTPLDECLGSPAPPTPRPHVLVPMRGPSSSQTRVHAGELRPVSWAPELGGAFCGLGPGPSLRHWLSPHCCALPKGWDPEAAPGFWEKPQHKQACC